MQCIVDLEDYQETCGTAITLGKFDGLHRGHQILLRKVRAYAEAEALKSVAFVFDMSVFYQKIKKEYQVLMTKEDAGNSWKDELIVWWSVRLQMRFVRWMQKYLFETFLWGNSMQNGS